ncbi:tRNA pseudouridine synthase D (macronuclear) [Tetrahymena thermophila SB210]|uniref:tRNA pseudouridine synthase D n=1 Tax=Tetrahymena thermophila (strain SB210) TaxID=312017 RepID=I7M0J5_TETTS|nr:tRNA pseudouridine synthase D [Tetrahymena thermophila SB210]EAR87715.1 tRNA pseudouridine synthase D [Tetrahymena thermophila SB210]|eukprot:XP_001007960.1 tRNA pseudouridine synthase D [Tetrahymena thermophila SB210]
MEQQKETLGETNVGITAFLTQGKPFKGIVKYRIQDFIVNEVTQEKETLYPSEKTIFQKQNNQKKDQSNQEAPQEEKKSEYEISDELSQKIKEIFGQEKGEKMIKFYNDLEAGLKAKENEFSILIDCPDEKEERLKIHQFVREELIHMDSSTEGDNAKKSIKVFFTKNKAKRGKIDQKVYHCVLFKNGIDNFTAIQNISKYLRLPPKNINAAGIKDKRGITTQLISIAMSNTSAEILNQRFQNSRWNNMKVQNVKDATSQLRTGDLYGNRFSLAIRLVSYEEQEVIKAVEDLKKLGFINYFGMQRFGTNNSIHTHEIGLLILKRQWEQVFDSIVGQETNDKRVNEAKKAFLKDKTQIRDALRDIPFKYKIERTLLQGYERVGMKNNFLQAICFLNRSTRNLYCHAYQSYIWNLLASYRIQTLGNQLVKGDIVAKKRENFLIDVEAEVEEENGQEEEQEEESKYQSIGDYEIEVIDDSNIDKYTLYDVLIPIIGGKLKIPENFNLNAYLTSILEKDGLDQQLFEKIQKEFFVEGGYRFLICQAEDVQYSINKYNEKNQDILTPYYNVQQDHSEENGKYSALCLKFTLAKGSYATMLIRELTKMPSDFDTQMGLNKEYQQLE